MSDEKHPNLAAALVAFQAEMPTVAKQKRANVGQYAYTYADLADITAAAMPILTRHGLAYAGSARPAATGNGYELVGILSHESGEQREGVLPITTSGTPQQLGSSITYARRYLFGVLTGVVTDNDDDGQLAQGAKKAPAKRAAPPPQPPVVETGEVMSDKTRARMHALLSEHGIRDRDERLTGIANVIGRPVESSNDLTQAEASKVIKDLEARPPRAPVAPPVAPPLAQQARPPRTEPPIDAPPPDLPEAEPVDEPAMTAPSAGILISNAMLAPLQAKLRAVLETVPHASATSGDDTHNLLAAILTKPVTSTKTLTRQDGMRVLDFLNRVHTGDAFVALDPETRVFETWVGGRDG